MSSHSSKQVSEASENTRLAWESSEKNLIPLYCVFSVAHDIIERRYLIEDLRASGYYRLEFLEGLQMLIS